jgi:hypothetical protein
MWGASVTQTTFDYDNRAVSPLVDMTFDKWWWVSVVVIKFFLYIVTYFVPQHNHFDYPPPPNTFTDLPAGGSVTVQLSCDIGFTDIWDLGPG